VGYRTHDQLITNALVEAGDTSLSTLASDWLNDWLDARYCDWPWPFCTTRLSYSWTSGTTSLTLGNGSGGVTERIRRILDPIKFRSSTFADRGSARIVDISGLPDSQDPDMNDSSTHVGLPSTFTVEASSAAAHQWVLKPQPVPDRALTVLIRYLHIPERITGSTVPLYPSDRTMEMAIIQKALAHKFGTHSNEALTAAKLLVSMVMDDRVKFGEVEGDKHHVRLDPKRFR